MPEMGPGQPVDIARCAAGLQREKSFIAARRFILWDRSGHRGAKEISARTTGLKGNEDITQRRRARARAIRQAHAMANTIECLLLRKPACHRPVEIVRRIASPPVCRGQAQTGYALVDEHSSMKTPQRPPDAECNERNGERSRGFW